MDLLIETLREEWVRLVQLSPRILVAMVVVAVAAVLGVVSARSIFSIMQRSGAPPIYRQFFANVARWVVILLGGVVALNVLGLRGLAASMMAGGGVLAVVLGFTFRGVGENFLAGFFLVLGRTFKVGDIIQSGEFQGTVRTIELRYTHIRAFDGRDIFIPSYDIFSKPLVNYTRDGLRRFSFTMGIDYADDVDRAREILKKTVTDSGLVLDEPGAGVRVNAFEANFVLLEVFFWIDTFVQAKAGTQVRTEVMCRCRKAVLDAGFTVSSEVTTNLKLDVPQRIGVEVTS